MKLDGKRGRAAALVARLGLGVVFAVAAIPKLIDPVGFATDIVAYHLLPDAIVGVIAVGLPVLELTVAAALICSIEARGASVIAALMLVAFTVGMTQAMARGIDLECGCFGSAAETRVSAMSIARNAGLLFLATFGAWAPETPWISRVLGGPGSGSP